MSRYLVISDIHSNLEALEAVLAASSKQKCDAVIVLGDLVGYGADPNAVVTRIRELKPVAVVRGMPMGPILVGDDLEICHGSPSDEDWYVVAELDALRSIEEARLPLCLFGHTHVAMSASLDPQRRLAIAAPQGHPELAVELIDESRYLINPGSVGQPRDGDSRAAYAIADLPNKLVTLYRVAYPIETAQKKILEAGLPPMLAYRLGMGR